MKIVQHTQLFFSHSFNMFSRLLILPTVVIGAAIQPRDPVPAGYVASPYYPGEHDQNRCQYDWL